MAQTEMMLRLLLKGKIVGRLSIRENGRVFILKKGKGINNWKDYSNTFVDDSNQELNYEHYYTLPPILCDSFEQGIKDNEWQFDGDIFKVTFINLATKHEPGTSFVGILKYLDGLGCWVISEGIRVSDVEVLYHERFDAEFRAVHLGNIHDNPELMEATDDTGQ